MWIQQNGSNAEWFCIEWYGGYPSYWTSYVWFGDAGEDFPTIRGTFIECVEWLQKQAEKRLADRDSASP